MIPAFLLFVMALSGPGDQAYAALRDRQYDRAISLFLQALSGAPETAALHKDLAYTYLKVGENQAARDHFGQAMRLAPEDEQAALEYAFLCHETKRQVEARRVFDRWRKRGSATAEQAFRGIDSALAEGIERWSKAAELDPNNFSAHRELAVLAEQRDEIALAARHYEKAWRLKPVQRSLMLDLGRVWQQLGRTREATAMLVAASRGAEPRVGEAARELLPARYPYVYEFREALALDPDSVQLHRELAYLLLAMKQNGEAELEFAAVLLRTPDDRLSAAQLGFLRLGRDDKTGAMPLLEQVLRGNDDELSDRVRFMLKLPRTLRQPAETARTKVSMEAKAFAERSFEKGYLNDASKYYNVAHDRDPLDFNVMLKLGWTNNLLKRDAPAAAWFGLARRSPDSTISAEAQRAWRNLESDSKRLRVSAWLLPMYSSRWKDTFAYAQVKAEWRFRGVPVRPYLSTRFIGDTRGRVDATVPQYLSENAFIFAGGLATPAWHGLMAWGEAGSAANYRTGKVLPDYRGGLAFAQRFGRKTFLENSEDGIFVSRFGNDMLLYTQNRFGRALAPWLRVFWNVNATVDWKSEYWANYVETGPGVGLQLPNGMQLNVNLLRGAYTINAGNLRRPNYWDFRAGVWYAFVH